jgi:hypothetical protein
MAISRMFEFQEGGSSAPPLDVDLAAMPHFFPEFLNPNGGPAASIP